VDIENLEDLSKIVTVISKKRTSYPPMRVSIIKRAYAQAWVSEVKSKLLRTITRQEYESKYVKKFYIMSNSQPGLCFMDITRVIATSLIVNGDIIKSTVVRKPLIKNYTETNFNYVSTSVLNSRFTYDIYIAYAKEKQEKVYYSSIEFFTKRTIPKFRLNRPLAKRWVTQSYLVRPNLPSITKSICKISVSTVHIESPTLPSYEFTFLTNQNMYKRDINRIYNNIEIEKTLFKTRLLFITICAKLNLLKIDVSNIKVHANNLSAISNAIQTIKSKNEKLFNRILNILEKEIVKD